MALSGIAPTAKIAWPIGSAPDLPWIVYTPEPGFVYADNENYERTCASTVSLYEANPDNELEGRVEAVLSGFSPYSRGVTTHLYSENCYVTEFTLDTIGEH